MTAPTCAVSTTVYLASGQPDLKAAISFKLASTDVSAGLGYVLPSEVYAVADPVTGLITANLWRNALGSSVYNVTIEGSEKTERTTCVVPDLASVALEAIAATPPSAPKPEGQVSVDAAVAAGAQALESATEAATSASAAATSAGAAAGSATAAATSASDAASSAGQAAASVTAAGTQATNAGTSATAAAGSATAAATSATNAATSATSAAGSATTATTQATTATTKAGEAAGSATTATTKASEAAGSAGAAAASATTASTQRALAQQAVTDAQAQVTLAAAQVTAAGTHAGEALASANAAAAQAVQAAAMKDEATVQAGKAGSSASSVLAIFGSAAAISASLAIGLGYASTAQAQANLSASYAASAASVAQQDLSGVTGAALHRSPNAVTAQFIYDTSKDSDGGLRLCEQSANTSWYNEPLNGPWLTSPNGVGHQRELEARLVGATLGAEATTNGDFSNGAVNWNAIGTGSTFTVSGGVGILTTSGSPVSPGVRYSAAGLTAGQLYVAVWTVDKGTAANMAGSHNGAFGGANLYDAGVKTITMPFVPNGTAFDLVVPNVAGLTTTIYKLSIKPVTAFNTTSGSYYQLATDGKFYRLSKNLVRYSTWPGSGGASTLPTGWAATGASGAACITGLAQEVVNGATTGVVKLRRVAATGFEGLSQTQAQSNTISLAAMAHGITIYVRVPTGVTASSLVFYDGTSNTTIASGTTLNAQAKDVWVPYTVSHTPTATRTAAGFCLNSAASGTGCDIAMPMVEIGAATTYEATGDNEVFRGNKAKFPRLAALVAEANNLTIYDLTEPGRPMWMRFVTSASNALIVAGSLTSAAMQNGRLITGANGSGLGQIDFIMDRGWRHITTGQETYLGSIAQRNAGLGKMLTSSAQPVAANTAVVNAVAMTVRPNAPIDPVTGLPVPTIAVAVGTGNAGQVGTVLMDDGSAVNYGQTGTDGAAVAFTERGDVCWTFSASTRMVAMPLATSNVGIITSASGIRDYTATSTPAVGAASVNAKRIARAGKVWAVQGGTAANRIDLVRENPSAATAGLAAYITGTYNTGLLVGDIRRAWLADTSAGTVSDASLVNNGNFATATDWTGQNSGVISISGGQMTVTNGNAAFGRAANSLQFPVVVGQAVEYTVTVPAGSANAVYANLADATTGAGMASLPPSMAPGGTYKGFLVSNVTGMAVFRLENQSSTNGASFTVSAVSVKAATADRSVKAKHLSTNGTLAKTIVATAAQMVAYSGFSATNYLQEAYSADLDFGTGAWTASAWANWTTAVAGTILDRSAATGAYFTLGTDATGHLTATAYDGTTTRTVTTTAAYNTGTWVKVRVEYATSGALTLKVNGEQVAQTTGAALLTLNNASAVCTVGNNRALTAAFPGSLALVKVGATVPFAEQSQWAYSQERAMFMDGAQVTLPDTGNVVDMAYDDRLDRLKVATAANECSFSGLVRVESAAVPAGSYSKAAMRSGVKLLARTTTNPGVDVSIASKNLIEELLRKAEDAARLARDQRVFDFDAVTSQTDFALPAGWEAIEVISAGASKREGAAKDWTRLYDGFKETVRFNVAPGNGTWVQATMRRAA